MVDREEQVLEEYTITVPKQLGNGRTLSETITLLATFKEENWKHLFWFIDEYVSVIKGRLGFDVEVAGVVEAGACTNKNSFGTLFTMSDLAFCLTMLDNNLDVWKQLVQFKEEGKGRPSAEEREKAKYTNNNTSTELRRRYKKVREMVGASMRHQLQDKDIFYREFYDYMKIKYEERSNLKEKGGGRNKRKRPEDDVDLDEQEDWAPFMDSVVNLTAI